MPDYAQRPTRPNYNDPPLEWGAVVVIGGLGLALLIAVGAAVIAFLPVELFR